MRLITILTTAAILVSVTPVFAEDAMAPMTGEMMMMKGGEVVAIMGDGHMGTMTADDAMMGEMMKMTKPLDGCVMFMTGSDGKTYMVDTSTDAAKDECEKIAK
ncbi:MAG: hypothetical protein ACOH2L_16945 [Devosia sp.]